MLFIAIVVLLTVVQVMPSVEREPLNVFPERTSLSQYGAGVPVTVLRMLVPPPVEVRFCMLVVLSGRRTRSTCRLLAFKVSRNITPALAAVLVFCSDATRTMICPSPVIGL